MTEIWLKNIFSEKLDYWRTYSSSYIHLVVCYLHPYLALRYSIVSRWLSFYSRGLRHPNVVNFMGVCTQEEGKEKTVYIVTEWVTKVLTYTYFVYKKITNKQLIFVCFFSYLGKYETIVKKHWTRNCLAATGHMEFGCCVGDDFFAFQEHHT